MKEFNITQLKIKICLKTIENLESSLKNTNSEEMRELINKRLDKLYIERKELMEKYPSEFLIL